MKKISVLLVLISVFIKNGPMRAYGFDSLMINGFISQGYLKTNQNNFLAETEDGTFQFNEMGISFRAFPTDRLRIGCQFFGRDLGAVGNDDIMVNWAFGEYFWTEWLGVRAGLIKIPGGFFNDLRDFDTLRTFVFLPLGVYNEVLRDGMDSAKGVEIFGNVPMGKLGVVRYELMMGVADIKEDSGAVVYFLNSRGDLFSDIGSIKMGNIYLSYFDWMTPIKGVTFRYIWASQVYEGIAILSGIGTPITFRSDPTTFQGFSLRYILYRLVLIAEHLRVIDDAATYISGNKLADNDREANGYYISASYRINDWLEIGTYFSDYENTKDKTGADNRLKDVCVALRYDINDSWLFKVEGHRMKGLLWIDHEEGELPPEEWNFYALKLSYSF